MTSQFAQIINNPAPGGRNMFASLVQSRLWNLALALVILIGSMIALYPSTADWFSTIGHVQTLRVYQSAVQSKNQTEQVQALLAATQYNDSLGPNTVLDPFAESTGNSAIAATETNESAAKAYDTLLNPAGDGVMATIVIPSIGLDLPIYHGTEDDTLARGIGHLYGTSLPVGGHRHTRSFDWA